jgi:hypothetical protein
VGTLWIVICDDTFLRNADNHVQDYAASSQSTFHGSDKESLHIHSLVAFCEVSRSIKNKTAVSSDTLKV